MKMADLPERHGIGALVLPIPTLPFAILTGAVDLFLLGGVAMALNLDLGSPIVMAINVAGSVAIYTALLYLFAQGEPRLWRNPARLRQIMTPDLIGDDAFNVTRAVIWQNGSVAIGRQMGCLAGLTAGASLSFRSEALAILAFVIVGGAIWLLASMLVSAPDRAELAPWIDRADDTAAPRQPDAGR